MVKNYIRLATLSGFGSKKTNSDSINVARIWLELREMKDKLDNEILPISGHLGIDDTEIIVA